MTLPDWNASDEAAAAPALDEWADVYGLDRALVYAVASHESRFVASAFLLDRNGGSYGLLQLDYPTAQGLGYTGSPAGLFDPATNAQWGLLYLRNQLDRYNGDVASAVSAYNAGTATSSNAAYTDDVLARQAYFTDELAGSTLTPDTTDTVSTGAPSAATLATGAVLLLGAWFLARRVL